MLTRLEFDADKHIACADPPNALFFIYNMDPDDTKIHC
ncbi:hypothetical protein BV360_05586 [Pseudomonas syringae pv. actinidiae]|nr:hypothetical protein BV340_03187 [Pseudomonas syringae pv. actinidiae]OSN25702.1 hypothetical protein BV341_03221 [Pseudomonas syringae pv. actinidiae]OSN34376.1 hypothetical protein BV342_03312 [Pseudomonas syringae pv. actinidiae]OSN58975.1 hypothetical protein BV347_03410 [Pseudomonas syringae pv. actinidiae]OSN70491.1 hypothetical protein BV350_03414 [Pseudomonas syringae pv. actinidiae]